MSRHTDLPGNGLPLEEINIDKRHRGSFMVPNMGGLRHGDADPMRPEESRTDQDWRTGLLDEHPRDTTGATGIADEHPHAVNDIFTKDMSPVDWDAPEDPENPMNWSPGMKWTNMGIVSMITLLTPLASSMFAPGVPRVDRDFGNSNSALSTFVVSVYLLGYAVGPLVIAPLSEIYGRLIIYHVCNVFFVIWTVACGFSTNMGMLIGFRFLAGCFGIAPATNGAGTTADIMTLEQRGRAMAVWQLGPLLGPIIGPIAGGFLTSVGWKWIFWVLALASGMCTAAAFVFLRETYAPVLLQRKTQSLRRQKGRSHLRSKLDQGLPRKTVFTRAIVRPTKLLFSSLVLALMSLYNAVVHAIMYLLFTTYTFVFQNNYGFSESIVGLVYIAIGIGLLLGLILGLASDPIAMRLAKKNGNGNLQPEYRLPMVMLLGPTIPIGLFVYGWTAQYQIHWAVPLLGTFFMGIGLIAAFMCINTYLVDTFTQYAASAMTANTILRSVLAAVFPLFGLQVYQTMGLGWGNSLLAFVSMALCPIPWLFYVYGERLRTHPRFQVKL